MSDDERLMRVTLDAAALGLEPLDAGEQSLAEIADWGPAKDWSDWVDSTG